MKTYSIPIRWESYMRIEVRAENLQEASEKAMNEFMAIPDDYYIDDSWEIDEVIYEETGESIDFYKLRNSLK